MFALFTSHSVIWQQWLFWNHSGQSFPFVWSVVSISIYYTLPCIFLSRYLSCNLFIILCAVLIVFQSLQLDDIIYREYFMESAGVRYLRTSCWRIRNGTSERSERVRFLIQNQPVRKYRTKPFPCGIVFIIYILRF